MGVNAGDQAHELTIINSTAYGGGWPSFMQPGSTLNNWYSENVVQQPFEPVDLNSWKFIEER